MRSWIKKISNNIKFLLLTTFISPLCTVLVWHCCFLPPFFAHPQRHHPPSDKQRYHCGHFLVEGLQCFAPPSLHGFCIPLYFFGFAAFLSPFTSCSLSLYPSPLLSFSSSWRCYCVLWRLDICYNLFSFSLPFFIPLYLPPFCLVRCALCDDQRWSIYHLAAVY